MEVPHTRRLEPFGWPIANVYPSTRFHAYLGGVGTLMGLIGGVVFGSASSVAVGVILWRRMVMEVPQRWQRPLDTATCLALVLLSAVPIAQTVRNAVSPIAFDFPVFYTVAVSAAEGRSFYDPASLISTFAGIQRTWGVPPAWLAEVGFWYPPPTALYLAPLGFLAYPGAVLVSHLVQIACFVVSMVVLHRHFPLRAGPMGLVEMSLLGLLFRPVISAFGLSQIVFGALLCLVVATATAVRKSWIAGLALGIGAVFKPLLLIPAALAIFLRRWQMTLAAAASVMAAGLAAGLVFGFDVYREFIINGPGDRSAQLAVDSVIQSLNAELRRIFDATPGGPGAIETILYPPYLAASAVITFITLGFGWKLRKSDWAVVVGFALTSLLALIVYPNTLYNTLPLMLPVLVVTLYRSKELAISPRIMVAFVAGIYGLVGTHPRFGFTALMITWLFLVGAIFRVLRQAKPVMALDPVA